MFDVIRKFAHWRTDIIDQPQSENIPTDENKLEAIFIKLYKIIVWRNPIISTLNIILVNFIFWFIQHLNFKFYGLIFSFLLLLTCEQLWSHQLSKFLFRKIEPKEKSDEIKLRNLHKRAEIDLNSSCAAQRFKSVLGCAYERATHLRHTNPAAFCSITCTCFLLLSGVGNYVSSVTSLYVLVMLCLTLPGIALHLLPSNICNIPHFIFSYCTGALDGKSGCTSPSEDFDVEFFLPEPTEEALEVLKLAGDLPHFDKSESDNFGDSFLKITGDGINDDTESFISKLTFYTESSATLPLEHSMEFLNVDADHEVFSDHQNALNDDVNFTNEHFDESSSDEEFALEMKLMDENDEAKESSRRVVSHAQEKKPSISIPKEQNKSKKEKDNAELSSDTDSFELISEEDV